jgi:hypothetical protein
MSGIASISVSECLNNSYSNNSYSPDRDFVALAEFFARIRR